jgi:hypothetical protein
MHHKNTASDLAITAAAATDRPQAHKIWDKISAVSVHLPDAIGSDYYISIA